MVAYKRLKTLENYKAVRYKNAGCGRLEVVVYERFKLEGFDWRLNWCFKSVVAYGRWSHMEVRVYEYKSDVYRLL